MAGIKCPKNGHACINFACQNGSAINCQWQHVETSTSTNTTLRPESPLKTRESGHFWIRLFGEHEFIIAKWTHFSWVVDGLHCPPKAIQEIDERRITREEPLVPKISGTSVRTLKKE